MKSPHLFESLRQELLGRGLSLSYIERVISELDDHRQDLLAETFGKEAGMNSGELALGKIGEAQTLANAFTDSYRSRTFAGRHPFWTFVVTPIPLTLLMWVGFYLAFVGLMTVLQETFGNRPLGPLGQQLGSFAFLLLFSGGKFLPAAASAILYSRWIRRSGRPCGWYIPSCLMIALVAACHQNRLLLPTEPGSGEFSIGFGTNLEPLHLAIPLLVGTLLYLKLRQPSLPAETVRAP